MIRKHGSIEYKKTGICYLANKLSKERDSFLEVVKMNIRKKVKSCLRGRTTLAQIQVGINCTSLCLGLEVRCFIIIRAAGFSNSCPNRIEEVRNLTIYATGCAKFMKGWM